MADVPFQPMQVGQILDKTTVVIIGPGVDALKLNDELHILAVGREIPNLGVPLVVPKGVLFVQSVAGAYVVARTDTYEVETNQTFGSLAILAPGRTETRRRQLSVDETQLAGNPSNTPVSVGDPVIRPADLPRFIASLSSKPNRYGEILRGKT
jgi:hypothetical protein